MSSSTAILLAAGLGTRMKSAHPKVLHPLGGRPMLRHLIAEAEQAFDRLVVVAGPPADAVARVADPHRVFVQHERLGTAHAALAAREAMDAGEVTVLYADNPLITAATMRTMRDARRHAGAGLAILAMRPDAPGAYGRVVTGPDGLVRRIVEAADASEAERAIGLCNAGAITADADDLRRWLARVGRENSKGEYYLTDVVAIAVADGVPVAAVEVDADEARGVNSRAELAEAEAILQRRLRAAAMAGGATLVAPDTVFLSADTMLAPDVTVEPHVVFGPGVSVAAGARIRAFSHLEGCRIGAGGMIGPYARIRPGSETGTDAHVGNFVELKATRLGDGAKANHLAYLGDSAIGARSNIGAGTITCNYDGVAKYRTTIGDDAFVGSDSVLVAPIAIGDGALVAAGSVLTADVPPDAMAFGRARQVNKDAAAAAFRRTRRDGGR